MRWPRTCLALTLLVIFECRTDTIRAKCGETRDLSAISMKDKYRFQTLKYLKQNYKNNWDCDWTFTLGNVCTEMRIKCHYKFRIQDSGSNCDADYLNVNDGSTSTRYCGTNRPDFHTTASSVQFHFSSNNFVRDRGLRCWARCSSTTPPQTLPTPGPCVCGKVNRGSSRISGGVITEVNEYPWMAALVSTDEIDPHCGGTLINDRYVLTAASCTYYDFADLLQVILGDHNWQTTSEAMQHRFNLTRIVCHPNYDHNLSADFDFALLELAQAVDYSDPALSNVRPACWPSQDVPVGASTIMTGWGNTGEYENISAVLYELEDLAHLRHHLAEEGEEDISFSLYQQLLLLLRLPRNRFRRQDQRRRRCRLLRKRPKLDRLKATAAVISNEVCGDIPLPYQRHGNPEDNPEGNPEARADPPTTPPPYYEITENMICAGDIVNGSGGGVCSGDTGGPMVWQNLESFEIQGVLSWGFGCGKPPAVSARVNAVLPWIMSVVGGGSANCDRNDTIPVTG